MANALDQENVLIAVDDIAVGRNITNIRQHHTAGSLKELAESIYKHGLMQALIVMDVEDPDTGEEITELVAGSRRLKAIKMILSDIDEDWTCAEDGTPAMVKVVQFSGTLEGAEMLNGIENLEREDVDDVDTAAWLHRQVSMNGMTQTQLSQELNKSPSWVSSRITVHKHGSDLLKKAMRPDFLATKDNPRGGALISFSTAYQLAKNLSQEEQDERIKKAIQQNEKLISHEEAEAAGDPNKSPRPSKKKRETMRSKAEDLAAKDAKKYIHARGAALALRWVDGLLTDDEMEEILAWESDSTPPAVAPAPVDDEDEDDEE